VPAGLTALVGTTLAVAVSRTSGQYARLRLLPVLRPLAAALAAVPKEVVIVAMRLVLPRPPLGQSVVLPLQQTGRAERAVEILSISFAPNRFVMQLLPSDRAQVHRLVP